MLESELVIVEDMQEFFAPASTDAIDALISCYNSERKRIESIAATAVDELSGVISYFLRGNDVQEYSASRMFGLPGAISCINADYWQRALQLTDVLNYMPQARRDEWNKIIKDMAAPEFTEESVRATLTDMLMNRSQFFAERVDGIFKNLSRNHVTNVPEGFSKRMIIEYVINSYGCVDHSRAGYINDLRCVISKFMGTDEPSWYSTSRIIEEARRNTGQWLHIDGGTLKIRVYKVGTAHLEVHPDMAYRLNGVLANLYPMAIPSKFRTKPGKKPKDFMVIQRPIPYEVRDVLREGEYFDETNYIRSRGYREQYEETINSFFMRGSSLAKAEAFKILESIGGVVDGHRAFFDYNARDVIREIITLGCVPDVKSHQYYPTPTELAEQAVDMADIQPEDTCLEPSAGTARIADLLPKDRTTCVELSALHCGVLKAKGYEPIQEDFLSWAQDTGKRFDKIVMNPPFSEGRAELHTRAAMYITNPKGAVVAILPSSYRNKTFQVPGNWEFTWSDDIKNAFSGTSVSVVIMKATKQ